MSDSTLPGGYSDGDIDTNGTDNPHLWQMIEARYSRRTTLGGIAAATMAVFGSGLLAACGSEDLGPVNGNITAGTNGLSRTGKVVILTGNVEGDNTSIIGWEQVSGPAVTLTNAGTNVASFIAPAVGGRDPARLPLLGAQCRRRDPHRRHVGHRRCRGARFQSGREEPARRRHRARRLHRHRALPPGDPIAAGVPAYANNGTDTDFAQRAGDHHDGMHYFGLNAAGTRDEDGNSAAACWCMNHENISRPYLHPTGATGTGAARAPEAEALKEIECHGVSVIEVAQDRRRLELQPGLAPSTAASRR